MASSSIGRFVWYELMTTDVPAAREFYRKVAGWTAKPFSEEGPEYLIWHSGEIGVGGLLELPDDLRARGIPSNWLGHIGVGDLKAIVGEATGRGAQLRAGPDSAPGVGSWAVMSDPQGATFSVFQPERADQEGPATPALGGFSWHELATTDPAAAFAFYSALFGWGRAAEHDMGAMGVYLIFGLDGQQHGGIYRKPAEMPAPPHWLHYIHVDSADSAAERITAGGGTILHGPAEVPGGDRITMALDPQGAAFAVHSRAGMAAG